MTLAKTHEELRRQAVVQEVEKNPTDSEVTSQLDFNIVGWAVRLQWTAGMTLILKKHCPSPWLFTKGYAFSRHIKYLFSYLSVMLTRKVSS